MASTAFLRIDLSRLSVFSRLVRVASVLRPSRRCMRLVWFCENARSTVWIAVTPASKLVLQSDVVADERDEEGDDFGDFDGDAVGEAVVNVAGDVVGDAVAEADGLASVMVIVVTPFCTVAVTSAPVVPRRNTAAM